MPVKIMDHVTVNINNVFSSYRNCTVRLVLLTHTLREEPIQYGEINMQRSISIQVLPKAPHIQAVLKTI